MKVTQSLRSFLEARLADHNGPDLLQVYLDHCPSLETQVNVAAGTGEPVAEKRNTYTDGTSEWFSFRIPRNAASEPEFTDWSISWPLDLHAEGIGSTGWDWNARCSRFVGFDFDAITGHAAGIGIADEELRRVREAAEALPYVQVRRSTGGAGIHLYVFLDAIPTANHTEHAALARCILGMMASEVGFDFASQIDACGGNMWLWHRKMTKENNGLSLLKPHTKTLTVDDLPSNWRDNVEVVTRRRQKVSVPGLVEGSGDPYDVLTQSHRRVPLDETHKRAIAELEDAGFCANWIADYHMLHTHTCGFAKLHESGQYRGVFQTISRGSKPQEPNCYAFPLPDGGWRINRFSAGINEAPTWNQDGLGVTHCFFNKRPNLATAAAARGGARLSEGGFQFATAREALVAVADLGEELELPEQFHGRQAVLKTSKSGELVVQVKGFAEMQQPNGWAMKRGNVMEKVCSVKTEPTIRDEAGFPEYEKLLRALRSTAHDAAGWVYRDERGAWDRQPRDDIRLILKSHGRTKDECEAILGHAAERRWTLVNVPFASEFLGDRRWNWDAPQLKYAPSEVPGPHPHWDMILKHCFSGLDASLRESPWANRVSIKTGYEYGLAWVACLLREPFQPLPYLFLYGPQNCGKSSLHEAIEELMTKGVASADRALTNQSEFNGELANCVLAYIQEKHLGKMAYARIKDWTTSPTIWIRRMRTDAYSQPNTLHFIQTANEAAACKLLPGDSRICVIQVTPFASEVPRQIMKERLQAEAPAFMRTLMDLTLPPVEGRLRLPVIETEAKERLADRNAHEIEAFINSECHRIPGQKIALNEFYEKFLEWLPTEDRYTWTKRRFVNELPDDVAYGAQNNNQRFLGNLSWDAAAVAGVPFIAHKGRLIQQNA